LVAGYEMLESRRVLTVAALFDPQTGLLSLGPNPDFPNSSIFVNLGVSELGRVTNEGATLIAVDPEGNPILVDANQVQRIFVQGSALFPNSVDLANLDENNMPNLEGTDIIGGAGNDLLVGSQLDDNIVGNGGEDRLKGNTGTDQLLGGSGTDRFDDLEPDELDLSDYSINLRVFSVQVTENTIPLNKSTLAKVLIVNQGEDVAQDSTMNISAGSNLILSAFDATLPPSMFPGEFVTKHLSVSGRDVGLGEVTAVVNANHGFFHFNSANVMVTSPNSSANLVQELIAVGGGNKVVSQKTPDTTKQIGTGNAPSDLRGQGNVVSADGSTVISTSQATDLDDSALANGVFDNLYLGDPILVDVQPNSLLGGNGPSISAVLSRFGEFVVFSSDANNLVEGINDPPRATGHDQTDVFLRNMVTAETMLISVASDGTSTGNDQSGSRIAPQLAVPPNGQFVAFVSQATNLTTGINLTAGISNVFLRNVVSGETHLISVAIDGTSGGNQSTDQLALSEDGRFVAFSGRANNLVGNDTNANGADVFLRDLLAGTTTLISRGPAGTSLAGDSFAPQISRDGRFVLFQSFATGLLAGVADTNIFPDLYLYDRVGDSLQLVSRRADGSAAGIQFGTEFAISGDGEFVVFVSDAPDLDINQPLANSGFGQSVYRWSRSTNQIELVSVTNDGVEAEAIQIDLSDDGRFVVFDSTADNLIASTTHRNIYVRDMQLQFTRLVSHSFGNSVTGGNGLSQDPRISDDGSTIYYESEATNLVDGILDENGGFDVFRSSIHRGLVLSVPSFVPGEQLTLRKNGDDLELFSVELDVVIRKLPADEAQFVSVLSNAAGNFSLTIDYDFGGQFFLPQGIELHGGSGGTDSLFIQGGTFATSKLIGTGNGAGFLIHSDGLSSSPIVFSGIEQIQDLTSTADRQISSAALILDAQDDIASKDTSFVLQQADEGPQYQLSDDGTGTIPNYQFTPPTGTLRLQGDASQDAWRLIGAFDDLNLILEGSAADDLLDFAHALEGIELNLDLFGVPQTLSAGSIILDDSPEQLAGTPFDDTIRITAKDVVRTLDGREGFNRLIVSSDGGELVDTGSQILLDGLVAVVYSNMQEVQLLPFSAPSLLSIERFDPAQQVTNADTLMFRLLFDEAVVNLEMTDFKVTGDSTATVTGVTPDSGSVEFLLTVSGGNLASFNGPVGIDLAAEQNIVDLQGNALLSLEPPIDQTYELDNIAARVGSIVVDDGTEQRSVIRSITINLDSEIIYAAGAIRLQNETGNTIAISINVQPGTATNQVVLTFPGLAGGSLTDGNYKLTIDHRLIADAAGNALDGDGDGIAGGDATNEFFRFFGDVDGDRDVDILDFLAFRRAFGTNSSRSGFSAYFDVDGDGDIDGGDFLQFRRRYGQVLNPPEGS
ncbi:MAG: PD40 domain-containing protein, partial [Planctomycetales bacterium]|nr:PD40 domain-containing protein [Planctomycetales bacterium]